jgi:hypothetical protein
LAFCSSAQQRVEKPFQIQLNFSGAFLRAFGEGLSDSEVTSFKVKDWAIPGFSLGYHLNRYLYVGYAFQPTRDLTLKEPWGLTQQFNDGNIAVNYGSGTFHNIDLRLSPFKAGLYVAVSLIHVPSVDYLMDFVRTGSVVRIGLNDYNTDLEIDWKFKEITSIGFGLGYNWVHRSGFSAGLGLQFPITSAPQYQDIVITPTSSNVTILSADLATATNRLEEESFYYPIQILINVGYNLNSLKFQTKNK